VTNKEATKPVNSSVSNVTLIWKQSEDGWIEIRNRIGKRFLNMDQH